MLFCLLQEATTCTKDSSLQAKSYTYEEDENQVILRSCKDTVDGHRSSGTAYLSMPNFLRRFFRGLITARSPKGSAHARHLFGHLESCVWPSSRIPNGRACGRLESDRILTGFFGRLQHGELPVPTKVFSDAVA